jgi:O-antigen ligase
VSASPNALSGMVRQRAEQLSSLWTLTMAGALTAVAGTELLVGLGRLGTVYAGLVPLVAIPSAVVGILAPNALLDFLVVAAPLLWALGAGIAGGGKVDLPMLMGLVTLIALGAHILVRDSDPGIERLRKLVILLALASLPSVFFAKSLLLGLGAYLRILFPQVVLFATSRLVSGGKAALRLLRLMTFSLISASVALAIAWSQSELWVPHGRYTVMAFPNGGPQGLGLYLTAIVAVILLSFYLVPRRIYFFILLPVLAVIYLAFIRTAWVGTALLIVLFVFLWKRSYGVWLVLVCLLAGAVYYSAVNNLLFRYASHFNSVKSWNLILSGRIGIDVLVWGAYAKSSLLHKIFGIGFWRSKDVTQAVVGTAFVTHDDYLAFLAEAGPISLFAYLAILFTLFRRGRLASRRGRGVVARRTGAFAAMLVVPYVIMGIPGAWYTNVLATFYLFSLMGLMLGQSRSDLPRAPAPL